MWQIRSLLAESEVACMDDSSVEDVSMLVHYADEYRVKHDICG